MNTQTIRNRVTSRIYGNKRGWVFTSSDFGDMGSMPAVRRTLERLTQKEVIRRLARGLYDYPEIDPDLGVVAPDFYTGVRQAIARQTKSRTIPLLAAYSTDPGDPQMALTDALLTMQGGSFCGYAVMFLRMYAISHFMQ